MSTQNTHEMQFGSYNMIFRDYLEQFGRSCRTGSIWFQTAPFAASGFFWGCAFLAAGTFEAGFRGNWLLSLPILFALASGSAHCVSLPFMLYLVPCSIGQRETYIQRMLLVKLAVPFAFGCLCDIVAMGMGILTVPVFLLQMAAIFILSGMNGMLNEGSLVTTERKAAFGGLQGWTGAVLIVCDLGGMEIAIICMGSVSWTEFWLVLAVMGILILPILVAVGKRWKQIRRNFADFEMAVKAND